MVFSHLNQYSAKDSETPPADLFSYESLSLWYFTLRTLPSLAFLDFQLCCFSSGRLLDSSWIPLFVYSLETHEGVSWGNCRTQFVYFLSGLTLLYCLVSAKTIVSYIFVCISSLVASKVGDVEVPKVMVLHYFIMQPVGESLGSFDQES